eukprot:3467396-Alexandrium_andersonii.AAC.2
MALVWARKRTELPAPTDMYHLASEAVLLALELAAANEGGLGRPASHRRSLLWRHRSPSRRGEEDVRFGGVGDVALHATNDGSW